jgi:hypothetical protein
MAKQRTAGQVVCSVALSPQLHQAVAEAADKATTSFSAVVRSIVTAWVLQQQAASQEASHVQ